MANKLVNIKVDASKNDGKLKHTWRYIGYDECNYTTEPGGEELIAKFGKLEDSPYYIRTHHLFCTGNTRGTVKWGSTNIYTEDGQGNPVYNWTVVDEIFDVFLRNNCKPFVELGFMPYDLVDEKYFSCENKWERYREYTRTTWACPPKDYKKWHDLVYNFVRHYVDKYGKEEVVTWYWELWNEPDIWYWQGSHEEYCRLFDYTEAAVHSALKEARLGGPGITGVFPGRTQEYLEKFFDHCVNGINHVTGEKGTQLDYVTFHVKGGGYHFEQDAEKEVPSIKRFTEQIKLGLEIMKKYGYEKCELVLTEADPDGWAAGGSYDNRNMNFRNTEYYATYIASSYHNAEKAARLYNADVRPLAWAFMFPGERCFEGTRTFSTQGIYKAAFNLFEMYAKMGDKKLAFVSSQEKDVLSFKDNFATGEEPQVSGMASISADGEIQVFIFSHHDDWDKDQEFDVELEVSNCFAGESARIKHYRIDQTHSNAYSEWVKQGKPRYPSTEQYAAIKERDALELLEPEKEVAITGGKVKEKFSLPAHGISLIVISKK